jgi:hypothetical protein
MISFLCPQKTRGKCKTWWTEMCLKKKKGWLKNLLIFFFILSFAMQPSRTSKASAKYPHLSRVAQRLIGSLPLLGVAQAFLLAVLSLLCWGCLLGMERHLLTPQWVCTLPTLELPDSSCFWIHDSAAVTLQYCQGFLRWGWGLKAHLSYSRRSFHILPGFDYASHRASLRHVTMDRASST